MERPNGLPSNTEQTNRIQNLSVGWKLACDPANQGKQLKWYENPPEAEARPALIPGIIQDVFPDYHGVAWYWTTFKPMLKQNPASAYALRFLEVDYFAEVWLNGVYLGSHEGAEFTFELDVQHALKFDAENLLVVRVINPIEEPIDGFVLGDTAHGVKFNKNYMSGAMYNYGGITQDVELIETDPVRILDVHAKADLKENAIKVSTTLRNELQTPAQGRLTATVRLRNSDLVLVRREVPSPSSSARERTSRRTRVMCGWPRMRRVTSREKSSRSTARALPAGTAVAWATSMTRLPSSAISSLSRPMPVSVSAERKELEQTSSAKPSLPWAGEKRWGFIS